MCCNTICNFYFVEFFALWTHIPLKRPFTFIYLFFYFFFLSTTRFFHPYRHLFSPLSCLSTLFSTSSFCFSVLPVSPFSSFKIFMFPHMKLLAQLLCLLFFFIAFFSNSVCLLLDFPTINLVRLPQFRY